MAIERPMMADDDNRRIREESMRDTSDATGALLRARDADRAERARQQRLGRQEERAAERRGDVIRASINAPHKVKVAGNQVAITIDPVPAQGGGDDAPTVLAYAVVQGSGSMTVELVKVHPA